MIMQDAEMAEPAELPGTEQHGRGLLHAFAAHWLGLVSEGQPHGESLAAHHPASFLRQPIGSRLPLPQASLLPCCFRRSNAI